MAESYINVFVASKAVKKGEKVDREGNKVVRFSTEKLIARIIYGKKIWPFGDFSN